MGGRKHALYPRPMKHEITRTPLSPSPPPPPPGYDGCIVILRPSLLLCRELNCSSRETLSTEDGNLFSVFPWYPIEFPRRNGGRGNLCVGRRHIGKEGCRVYRRDGLIIPILFLSAGFILVSLSWCLSSRATGSIAPVSDQFRPVNVTSVYLSLRCPYLLSSETTAKGTGLEKCLSSDPAHGEERVVPPHLTTTCVVLCHSTLIVTSSSLKHD